MWHLALHVSDNGNCLIFCVVPNWISLLSQWREVIQRYNGCSNCSSSVRILSCLNLCLDSLIIDCGIVIEITDRLSQTLVVHISLTIRLYLRNFSLNQLLVVFSVINLVELIAVFIAARIHSGQTGVALVLIHLTQDVMVTGGCDGIYHILLWRVIVQIKLLRLSLTSHLPCCGCQILNISFLLNLA